MNEEIPAVNIKSTKSTIFAAYQAALQKIKQTNENSMNVSKTKKEAEKNNAISGAETALSIDSIEILIRQVESFSSALTQELGLYENIKKAIEAKQEDLEELFGIEKTAESLSAIVDANAAMVSKFNEDKKKRIEELEALVRTTDLDIKAKKEEYVAELEKRIKEDEYAFSRSKMIRENDLEDSLNEKKKEAFNAIAEKHEELKIRIKDIQNREAMLLAKEQEVDNLRKEVDAIPEKIASAVKAEVGKEKAILNSAFEKEKQYITSTLTTETKVIASKAAELQKVVDSQVNTITELQSKLDSAYKEIKEMAVKTVEGIGSKQMINDLMQKIGDTTSSKK